MQVEGQRGPSLLGLAATGEWVSDTYPTCPSLGDSPPKGELIPYAARAPHGTFAKDSSVTDGDAPD